MSEAKERWGVWCEQENPRRAEWLSDYAGDDAGSKPAEFTTQAQAEECAVRSRLRNATWRYEARLLLVPASELAKTKEMLRATIGIIENFRPLAHAAKAIVDDGWPEYPGKGVPVSLEARLATLQKAYEGIAEMVENADAEVRASSPST